MEQSTFSAALFDLDGVVFDTEPQYTLFWGSQCRLYHPDRPGLEREIKGQTLVQIFDRLFSGPLEAERAVVTRRLDSFEQNMAFDYVEGFLPYITTLRRRGVRTALVTSSNLDKMAKVYERRPEIVPLFDVILTSEDFARSKPDPDCYLQAAARLGVPPEQCVVFEDSFNGLRSGRAAAMRVVGLSTTNAAADITPLADIVIGDYTQLPDGCLPLG